MLSISSGKSRYRCKYVINYLAEFTRNRCTGNEEFVNGCIKMYVLPTLMILAWMMKRLKKMFEIFSVH